MTQSQAYREKYLLSPANFGVPVRNLGTVERTVVANPVHPSPYFLWLNGTYKIYDVKPGAIVDLEVRRLDVDDVAVTREDGTTFSQKGSYSVEWRQPDGTYVTIPLLQQRSTRTGVDLVPGHYRVTVDYTTAEPPGSKQDVYEIDLM